MVVIDFHVHIDEGENSNANGVPVQMGREEILKNMDDAGIDISVLLVMAFKGEMKKTREKNEWLADVCRQDDRLVGFGSVHPNDGKPALEEMDHCINDLGLKGFKLHPNTQGFDCSDPSFLGVLKRVAELDVPVIIDTYSPWDHAQPAKLFKTYWATPDTKACLAHVGMWQYMDFGVYGFLRQRTILELNAYFDLSASIPLYYKTPFQEQFFWITQQIGPDHLLFGSDFPLFHPKKGSEFPLLTPKYALNATKDFGYQEDWIPKIIGENAAKLLKI